MAQGIHIPTLGFLSNPKPPSAPSMPPPLPSRELGHYLGTEGRAKVNLSAYLDYVVRGQAICTPVIPAPLHTRMLLPSGVLQDESCCGIDE